MIYREKIEGEGHIRGKRPGEGPEVLGNLAPPGPLFMGRDEVMDDFFLGGGYGKHSNRESRVLWYKLEQGMQRILFIRCQISDLLFYP
jgi:hypothetical protein